MNYTLNINNTNGKAINQTGNNSSNMPILNTIKNRLLILSPTVAEGIEREANKDDFEALDDKALGKGGFGHVWKVRHKQTGKIFAIKVINKDYIRKENMVEQINREIEIMYRTDHPHIIKLYNHYEDDENFYLIMHCASKGQLYSQLKRLKRLDERTVAQYMREVISAVKYLHSLKPPIIHRDIKPENVLLDSDGRAKLADFGWSNFYEENKKRETYCGTPEYLAPEMVTKSGHNEAIDVWSLGVLMFELLAGRPPFVYKGDPAALYSDIKSLKIKWTDDFPLMAKNLISKILKLKPMERPSLDDILEHPWFKETPLLRPLLQMEKYDPEAKLRSHLISYTQEDEDKIQDKIRLALNKRRDSIKSENSSNSTNITNPSNMTNTINNNALNTHNATINNYSQQNRKNTEVEESETKDIISNLKNITVTLKEEISKKDKIITELNNKISKMQEDEMTLRIRDQERYGFINELEIKSKKLLEIESQLSIINSEHTQLLRQHQGLKENFDEINEKNKNMEKIVNEFNLKLNLLDQEKQQEIINYEKKLRIAELNYVEKDTNFKEIDIDKIYSMTKEYVYELVELIRKKISNLSENIINHEKSEADFRSKLIENIDRKLKDAVDNLKETHERLLIEEKNLFNKRLEELEAKNASATKSVDWYKAQISELYPYKQKYNQDAYMLNKLTEEREILLSAKKIYEEKNFFLENYIKSLNETVDELKNSRDKYKNAFSDSEKLFIKYVKNKNLRELINFKETF